jgi:hypothetical protein
MISLGGGGVSYFEEVRNKCLYTQKHSLILRIQKVIIKDL